MQHRPHRPRVPDTGDWDRIEATARRLRADRGLELVYNAADQAADPAVDVRPNIDAGPPPGWDENAPPVGADAPPAAAPAAQKAGIRVLSLADLQAESAAVTWLVKRVVPASSVGILFGGSGSFKSFVALDLALHVAHGLQWLGRRTRRAPVVYVAAEGGAGLWPRVQAWHLAHRLDWGDCDMRVIAQSVDMMTDAGQVFDAVQALGVEPGLVVVDTMSQTFAGDENSAQEVSEYLRKLGAWFRDAWACAVLVIHHTGHMATERPRGSSALRANVDFMLGCHREEKEMLATVSAAKQKDGELMADQVFALSVVEVGRDDDDEAITSLAARAVLSEAERQDLVQREAARGRSGRNAQLLQLAQQGMRIEELRKAFGDLIDGDSDARRQAWHRALGWAKKAGLLEVVEGRVLLSKAVRDISEA
jgi:hypothetical protein